MTLIRRLILALLIATIALGLGSAALAFDGEPAIYEAAKKEKEFTWYTAHYNSETAAALCQGFEKKYPGQVPTILEASAHDGARMARQVIESRVQTRDALRDGLARIRGFRGATGDITMGPARTPEKELFFLTVDQNGLREMTKEELAAPGAGGGRGSAAAGRAPPREGSRGTRCRRPAGFRAGRRPARSAPPPPRRSPGSGAAPGRARAEPRHRPG